MNDFEYDVMQRRRLARQARYRRTHTGKSGCNLSSDRLTQKQWKERCGEVFVCNLNKPMNWSDFKTLSRDTQTEYILTLSEKYGANVTNLAKMFGISPVTLRRFLDSNGINIKFKVGHSMTNAQRSVWDQFCSGDSAKQTDMPEEDAQDDVRLGDVTIVQPVHSSKDAKMRMTSFTVHFGGEIDPMAIANTVKSMVGGQRYGVVTVTCELLAENF